MDSRKSERAQKKESLIERDLKLHTTLPVDKLFDISGWVHEKNEKESSQKKKAMSMGTCVLDSTPRELGCDIRKEELVEEIYQSFGTLDVVAESSQFSAHSELARVRLISEEEKYIKPLTGPIDSPSKNPDLVGMPSPVFSSDLPKSMAEIYALSNQNRVKNREKKKMKRSCPIDPNLPFPDLEKSKKMEDCSTFLGSIDWAAKHATNRTTTQTKDFSEGPKSETNFKWKRQRNDRDTKHAGKSFDFRAAASRFSD